MKKIVLIGGGGHCKSVIDVIESCNTFQIIGIVDNNLQVGDDICGYKVIGKDEDLKQIKTSVDYALVTVGQVSIKSNREQLYQMLKKMDFKIPYIISKYAYVSKYAKIHEGSVVHHGAIVNAGAIVGRNCIINSKALIEHDAYIQDHCHISTNVVINGGVEIGSNSFIGSSSVIKEYVIIDNYSFIKAQSLVK